MLNTLTEVWAPVPGYEGWYDVSADGQVMRVNKNQGTVPGRILKPQVSGGGYWRVTLMAGDGRKAAKRVLVHRLVAAAFLGPAPHRAQVNHKDGDKRNNELGNLEYVTPSQNVRHAERSGLRAKRAGPTFYRLTADGVREIRRRWRAGETQTSLADAFGVSRVHVSNVVRRVVWAHLED